MTRTIKRLDNGEQDLSTGKIQYLTGLEGLAQRHKTRLKVFQGEWIFDKSLGIPYIGPILGAKGIKVSEVQSIFISELLKVQGTKAITSMTVEDFPGTRELKITYSGVSDDGETFTDQEITI